MAEKDCGNCDVNDCFYCPYEPRKPVGVMMENAETPASPGPVERPCYEPDYAFATIEEYEKITGFRVSEAFRIGWDMARTTNRLLSKLGGA